MTAIPNILRLTAQWKPHAAAAYEMAALAIEAGAESLTPEQRREFIDAGSQPPRSITNQARLIHELREAVYNASTSRSLTENQAKVDAELTALGISI